MSRLLERLRGGLIASCQPVDGGPMDRPEIVSAMAEAAERGGAAGLRIEGVENLRAARAAVDLPIIGIVKSDSPETPVRITVSTENARDLVAAGADVVAYDATDRPRQDSRDTVLKAILEAGATAMADCATLDDGRYALANGAAILGTTLSGYTTDTASDDASPDFDLIRAFDRLGAFVMAEGRFDTPELAASAMRAGADAVTVGSALTRLEIVTARFASAIQCATQEKSLNGFSVDLGGTKTATAHIVDGRVERALDLPTQGDADPEAQIDGIASHLRDLGFQRGDTLGFAVTGRVDRCGNWYAVNKNTLHKVDAYPLSKRVAETIGAASVINDAAAATLAEHRIGSGQNHDNFGYVTVSTGVGGGVMLNGRLLQSQNGLAGHIGFNSSPAGNAMCGSGRFGTVESVASGWAIANRAEQVGHPSLDARAVFAEAQAGQEWAIEIADTSANAVAELSADLVAILGLTRIAIGGSIGLSPGYVDRVQKHLSQLPELFQIDLVPAALGKNGPLLGALLHANECG